MRVQTKLNLLTAALLTSSSSAFLAQSPHRCQNASSSKIDTSLNVCNDRRSLLRGIAGVTFGTVASVFNGEPASASYSAYTAREKDWQQRQENGEIQYSTARDLKQALREVAPMNSEKSKVFCPNGMSSAVSPLQENKCNDRLAMPSVYGRTEDIVGNSIPGFREGYPAINSSSGSTLAEAGGFPSYKK